MQKTIGGDRLGSGNKMKVDLRHYERSTHDLSYLWRSTMAAGTLVPFMSEVALPGDTFDITLDCDIMTHPTLGPLFGSYKVQLDIFEAPIRLYNAKLHNNALGIGLNMATIKLPYITLQADKYNNTIGFAKDIDNSQINPSCLLAYLGIRGLGLNGDAANYRYRTFNAVPFLAYWDIYKNYYANKQEEIGAMIHTPIDDIQTIGQLSYTNLDGSSANIPDNTAPLPSPVRCDYMLEIDTANPIHPEQIMVDTTIGVFSAEQLTTGFIPGGAGQYLGFIDKTRYGTIYIYSWHYRTNQEATGVQPKVLTFPLANIDEMRNRILADVANPNAFEVPKDIAGPGTPFYPYAPTIGWNNTGYSHTLSNQEGLALKTYQSDLFNNWIKTEWIDGPNGIAAVTAIDTTGNKFTIDTFLLSKKVYDMLNRIAVSGGSYNDWIDTVYQENKYTICTTPIYHGGLIKELVFQQVISNSASTAAGGDQPLGTLAGRGTMAQKHKGGSATIKVNEPSYIIGIISLTPRIDYSQGNKWDVNLKTVDDLHKPALDEIGYQELITDQMAWWDSHLFGPGDHDIVFRSAGKQPAWLNYMTNVNRTYGNFAIQQNEMFMTLNRRYEFDRDADPTFSYIKDLTTYIDPAKYNNIFAQTSLDSQNFWAQIAVNITARRLMSAKIMPNL